MKQEIHRCFMFSFFAYTLSCCYHKIDKEGGYEMEQRLYDVFVDKECVASSLSIVYAMILTEGIFERYYNDSTLSVTIKVHPSEIYK